MEILDIKKRLHNSPYWRDIAWLASGNALAQVIGILAMPLLTRLYTPSDFALQNLFLQVMGFAVVVFTYRYEYFIQLPKDNEDAYQLILLVIALGLIGCIVSTPLIWIFKDTLSHWLGAPDLKYFLIFVPLTAILVSFSIAIQHLAQRKELYRYSSLSELANKGTYVSVALVGYWILTTPAGLILSTIGGCIGKIFSLYHLWIKKKWPVKQLQKKSNITHLFNIKKLKKTAHSYFLLSSSLAASHLLLSCTAIIPSIYITHTYNSNTLGQFALALTTIFLPSGLIGNAIGQVYYQRAAERWAAGQDFSMLWQSTAKRLAVLAIPVYVIIILISPWAYPVIFGENWRDAGNYASIMAVAAFFSFITSPLDRGCLVINAWKYVLAWHSMRTLTTALVALLAWRYDWKMTTFIVALTFQMSIIYLIDYWMNWRFSKKSPSKIKSS